MPGRWRSDNSPWVREVMEVFQEVGVTDLAVMCSAQSAKTQTVMNLLCWVVACAPGPMMWVMAALDEAKTFCRTRLMPTLWSCAPVAERMPIGRADKTMLEVNFDSMPLVVNGANSPSKLQSKPCRYLFLDEVRNYPPGALEMVLKRTRAFWNCKRFVISTPDAADDAVDRAFQAGDQRRYHVACPNCGQRQHLVWAQMKWDKNDITCPAGEWNFDALAGTIRYECSACKHAIPDIPERRKALARSGCWVKSNPRAPSNRASFHWNAILPPWVKWRDLVEEFLRAKIAFRLGTIEPLKAFINESLGEPWVEDYFFMGDEKPQTFDVQSEWPEECRRFLTADKQAAGGEHYWVVVRAWSQKGESRRLWWGKLYSWDEIRAKQIEFKVSDNSVLIDSGYEAREVYRECARYGWIALKGEDVQHFLHIEKRGNRQVQVRRSYAPLSRGDPEIGRH